MFLKMVLKKSFTNIKKYSDGESSSEVNARTHRGRYKYISDSSEIDCKPRRRNYKPYEEISGEFKKIKPPMFNGEVEKSEEAESWLSGMKKYLHIYNYFDRLKAQMDIYNLTEKADIWWQDIKRVKNIKEKYLTWRVLKIILKGNFYLNNTTRKDIRNSMN